MVVLGLVLMVIAAVVAVGVLLDNAEPVALSFYGVGISNATVPAILVIGIVIAVMFVVGLWLVGSGARRGRRRRREFRRLQTTASDVGGGPEDAETGSRPSAGGPDEETDVGTDSPRAATGSAAETGSGPASGVTDEGTDAESPEAADRTPETRPLENHGEHRGTTPTQRPGG